MYLQDVFTRRYLTGASQTREIFSFQTKCPIEAAVPGRGDVVVGRYAGHKGCPHL